jgi:hypothetical protein
MFCVTTLAKKLTSKFTKASYYALTCLHNPSLGSALASSTNGYLLRDTLHIDNLFAKAEALQDIVYNT